jgi:hypothetical protein
MTSEKPPQAICPHCGSEFDYEELCRVCGKLADGNVTVSKVSLVQVLGNFFSRMHEKGFHGAATDGELKEDPWSAHGWSTHTGNLFHHDKD